MDLSKARKEFRDHFWRAKRRGVEFKFSFDEWLSIWMKSGHYEERGCGSMQYQMQRIKDLGAYEVGNVTIGRQTDNALTRGQRGRWGKAHDGHALSGLQTVFIYGGSEPLHLQPPDEILTAEEEEFDF